MLVDTGHRDRSVLGRPTFGGLAMALLFWWESLVPTLIPRPWVAQALISAVCSAVGYGIGTLVWRCVAWLLVRCGRTPGETTQLWGWRALVVGWLIGIGYGSVLWLRWQNEQRDLMGMPTVGWFAAAAMIMVAAIAAAMLVVAGRGIGRGVGALLRFGRRNLRNESLLRRRFFLVWDWFWCSSAGSRSVG